MAAFFRMILSFYSRFLCPDSLSLTYFEESSMYDTRCFALFAFAFFLILFYAFVGFFDELREDLLNESVQDDGRRPPFDLPFFYFLCLFCPLADITFLEFRLRKHGWMVFCFSF